MTISITTNDNVYIISVSGLIDFFNASELRDEIDALIDKGIVRIIIDLKEVHFVDSSGIGAFISCSSRLQRLDGSLALVNPQRTVMDVFKMTSIYNYLQIFDSIEDAKNSLPAKDDTQKG